MNGDIIKVFLGATISFMVGIGITPTLSNFFYKYKLWKRVAREENNQDKNGLGVSVAYQSIHNKDEEVRTPRVGGMVVWGAVLVTMFVLFLISKFFPADIGRRFDFVSRNQTLLPLCALLLGALVGFFEDCLEIYTGKFKNFVHGLSAKYLISIITTLGFLFASWFYFKLGVSSIHIPLAGEWDLGWFFIPFFILVMLGTFSSRVIDGVDGLSGGVLASIFASYTAIAFFHNQIDIAAFCAVVTGAILAFLWFNIPPARFYMGETGMLALSMCLTVVAFLTNTAVLLLVIAFPLVATALSSAIQIFSKKYFHKKVFKIAPLHHHFEALGWSRPKITMRYWIISVICAILGIIISVVG